MLVGHSQSLDLIAALPGLRNWPEVMAFPGRVAACELDSTSVSRLAYRLNRKFSLEIGPKAQGSKAWLKHFDVRPLRR